MKRSMSLRGGVGWLEEWECWRRNEEEQEGQEEEEKEEYGMRMSGRVGGLEEEEDD